MDAHVTVNTVRRYYYTTVAGDTSGKALENLARGFDFEELLQRGVEVAREAVSVHGEFVERIDLGVAGLAVENGLFDVAAAFQAPLHVRHLFGELAFEGAPGCRSS